MAIRYKQFPKVGPGGWNCPCCTVYPPGKRLKRWRNKMVRRRLKRELNKELKSTRSEGE